MNTPFAHSSARPWSEVTETALARVVGVLTDIDDTLTTEGEITPDALAALVSLRAAGLPVIATTGRPLGWAEERTRHWPLAAVVAESGALALLREPEGNVQVLYAQDEATRRLNTERLQAALVAIQRAVPEARPAPDHGGSVTDLSIDHSETFHLDEAQIDRVLQVMRAQGMTASVSSIHVNGWYGEHSKLTGARWMIDHLFGRALDTERDRWVFTGDSANDQAMFGYFPLAVGVANVMRFADRLTAWPAYITKGERGAGFAEVAAAVLAARD
jgi:HAD superfamily hydrolase (TIGR01484 family)